MTFSEGRVHLWSTELCVTCSQSFVTKKYLQAPVTWGAHPGVITSLGFNGGERVCRHRPEQSLKKYDFPWTQHMVFRPRDPSSSPLPLRVTHTCWCSCCSGLQTKCYWLGRSVVKSSLSLPGPSWSLCSRLRCHTAWKYTEPLSWGFQGILRSTQHQRPLSRSLGTWAFWAGMWPWPSCPSLGSQSAS